MQFGSKQPIYPGDGVSLSKVAIPPTPDRAPNPPFLKKRVSNPHFPPPSLFGPRNPLSRKYGFGACLGPRESQVQGKDVASARHQTIHNVHILDIFETPVTVTPQQEISKNLKSDKIFYKYLTFAFREIKLLCGK